MNTTAQNIHSQLADIYTRFLKATSDLHNQRFTMSATAFNSAFKKQAAPFIEEYTAAESLIGKWADGNHPVHAQRAVADAKAELNIYAAGVLNALQNPNERTMQPRVAGGIEALLRNNPDHWDTPQEI